jgi:hypothetical protein
MARGEPANSPHSRGAIFAVAAGAVCRPDAIGKWLNELKNALRW